MKKRKILITGDSITFYHIYEGNTFFPDTTSERGTQVIQAPGGAALLGSLLRGIFRGDSQVEIQFQHADGEGNKVFAIWSPCPGNRKEGGESANVPARWRITKLLGYGPISSAPDGKKRSASPEAPCWDLVVFEDDALHFRHNRRIWPEFLSHNEKGTSPWIIFRMSHPVGKGDLWAELCSKHLQSKTILIVSADDLRRNEVMISRGRSWDQTVQDLLGEIDANIQLKQLMQCRHLIIHFRSEGALWIDNSNSGQSRHTVFFDPGYLEGEWEKGFIGQVLGGATCFTAGVVTHFLENFQRPDELGMGISRGLCAMRTLLQEGHGVVGEERPSFPFPEVQKCLTGEGEWRFHGVVLPERKVVCAASWSFIERVSVKGKRPLYGRARHVARKGTGALKDVPFGRFGLFYTVDRFELEGLNSIRQLINQYVKNDKETKPLSIAVFGPPGSGKSFGVNQIAKGILGEDVPTLEFNLAQFDSHEMLIGALHQVRDHVLRGRIPVVFWDEFDSEELKWLQYLLSPMKDGVFLEGQISHPIGKCIFVFAGGTSPTMEAFSPPKPDESEKERYEEAKRMIYDSFRSKKGPDFVSRLRGYLNVLGPNPRLRWNSETGKMEVDPTDTCFPIRRAFLLRVALGLKDDEPLTIDSGLLNAFLKVKEYKHGARSMSVIVKLILGEEGGGLMRSSLPPREQLSLHVDYDEFIRLIQQDREFQSICERIAPHVHEHYRELCRERGEGFLYDVDFDKLPANIQADNIAATRRITDVLSLISMQIVPKGKGEGLDPKEIKSEIENNIERCRPYFIGILAERYGWVPEEIDPALTEAQPWLKEHTKKSITELEIIHGVLKNPEMAERAYFYFRDPAYIETIPKERRPDFLPETPEARKKLLSLKEKIKESGLPVRENYPDPKALGRMVLEDLWAVIDKRFPLKEVPSELERERQEHEAFARSRARVYIGRKAYFERLNAHVASKDPPLVLTGESGVGKSALISNWIIRYRTSHPDEFILFHFIGSSPKSADYLGIIRRIMAEIKERFGVEDEIPASPEKLREELPLWLARASAQGGMILILDGLNQLEDRDNARHLGWLPAYFPPDIRVILSTLPGPSLDAVEKRGWATYRIEPFTCQEQERMIEDYLAQYRKRLDRSQVTRILSFPQTANPLYLRVLLEELRVFGMYEELEERIAYYLEARDVPDLYDRVLGRLEKDYERERPGLVGEALSLIWASRRGLSEAELLEIMGSKDTPLPRALWSPLYLAMEEALVNRSGLLGFFHDYLRQAVHARYIKTKQEERRLHIRLAGYFERQEAIERKADELPWQLFQAGQWARLKDTLTDMETFLFYMKSKDEYELMPYWRALEKEGYDMEPACLEGLERYEEKGPGEKDLASALNQTAAFLWLNARYKAAEPLYRRALKIHEKVLGEKHPDTAATLNNLALLLHDKGDYDGAEPLYRRAMGIHEKVLGPEHPDTATSLNNLADLLRAEGDYDGAEPLFRRALEIREKVFGPEHPSTATSLNNLAELLRDKKAYESACHLFEEFIHRFEGKEDKSPIIHQNLALAHNELAVYRYRAQGDWEQAEAHFTRSLELYKRTDLTLDIANVELSLQQALHAQGKPVDTKRVKEATRTLDEAGDPRSPKGHELLEELS